VPAPLTALMSAVPFGEPRANGGVTEFAFEQKASGGCSRNSTVLSAQLSQAGLCLRRGRKPLLAAAEHETAALLPKDLHSWTSRPRAVKRASQEIHKFEASQPLRVVDAAAHALILAAALLPKTSLVAIPSYRLALALEEL